MWREFQLLPFTGMALGISVTLTVTMIVFTYLLFLNLFAQSFARSLLVVLFVLGVVTLTLVLLTVTQLLYVTVTARRDAQVTAQARAWEAHLTAFLAGADPPATLDVTGARALLHLREARPGPDGARLAALYDTLGLRAHDERVARSGRNTTDRTMALERLVTLRDDRSLPVFLALLDDASTSLRLLALLGVTRLARPGWAAPPLLPVLTSGLFSTQQVREALCLLGAQAEPLVRTLTADPRDPWRELAVDTTGRLDPPRYADLVPDLLRDASAGVRAGALRLYAAGRLDTPPAAARGMAAQPRLGVGGAGHECPGAGHLPAPAGPDAVAAAGRPELVGAAPRRPVTPGERRGPRGAARGGRAAPGPVRA